MSGWIRALNAVSMRIDENQAKLAIEPRTWLDILNQLISIGNAYLQLRHF